MEYEVRLATLDDVPAALNVAWRMFVKYDSQDYGIEHTERMRTAIEGRLRDLSIYSLNKRLLAVALVDNRVVGMIETYGTNRISFLFVDSAYQRNGIATAMMSRIAEELTLRGYDKIVLNSSPKGLAFYIHFGFKIEEDEKNADTLWKTPMSYTLKA